MEQKYKVRGHTNGQKEEKRQPAQDEHPHNDGEGLRSLFLPGELHQPHRQRTSERVVLAALGTGRARVLQHAAAVDPEHHFHRLVPLSLDARFQTLGSPAGHHVDPKIHDEDDHEREVEREERGEERVARLLRDAADALIHGRRFFPSQQRPDRDHRGQNPNQDQNSHRFPLRHDARVFQAVLNTYVPVDGDDAEAEDGRGAAEHIHRSPDVTEHPAKHPASQHLQRGGEGQHDNAQQQVRHGQVDDEEVCDGLQMSVAHHGQDDQNVPNNRHQDENGENDPDPDNL